jgi:hypothetical protein
MVNFDAKVLNEKVNEKFLETTNLPGTSVLMVGRRRSTALPTSLLIGR